MDALHGASKIASEEILEVAVETLASACVVVDEDLSETLEFAADSMEKGSDAMSKAGDRAEAAEIRVAHYAEVAPERSNAYNTYGCLLPYKALDEADLLGSIPIREKYFSSKAKRAALGDSLVDGNSKSRSVLGDVTNQLGKRRFVSIPSNSNDKKNAENKCGQGNFVQEISSGEENLLRGKQDDSQFLVGGKKDVILQKASGGRGSLNLGSTNVQLPKGKTVSSVAGFPSEIKEFSGFFDGNRLVVLDSKGEPISGDIKRNASLEAEIPTTVCENKPSSIESPSPSGSAVPKVPEMHMSTGLGNADCSNSMPGMASLKNCSCSFCLKAAYIWSDLHYQDAKCRLSAIKKSRKEFRLVMEKCLNGRGACGNSSQEASNKSAELESDLLGQWRSLFLHNDKILEHEGSHLQSSILKLEELREDCKADLEMLHPTAPKT